MNLIFEPITNKNRTAVENLRPFDEQVNYIESVAECLMEAEGCDAWKPVGIYDDDVLVGFAMYGYFMQTQLDGRLWFDRLLIDRAYQGQGYGRAAVSALLKKLAEEYTQKRVYLSVYDVNQSAIHIYEELGFRLTENWIPKGNESWCMSLSSGSPSLAAQ